MSPEIVTPEQARLIARQLFLQPYPDQAVWFDLAWDCYARLSSQEGGLPNLAALPGLGAGALADPFTAEMVRQFVGFAAAFLIKSSMAADQLRERLQQECKRAGKPQPQIDELLKSFDKMLRGAEERFFVWISRSHPVPSTDEKPHLTAMQIKEYRQARDDYHIFVDCGNVWIKSGPRKTLTEIPDFGRVDTTLLCILLRYRDGQAETRGLYQRLWGDAADPILSERDIVLGHLALTMTRFRHHMTEYLPQEVFTVPTKRRGYFCRGSFSSCVIVPAAAEPNFRVPRVQ